MIKNIIHIILNLFSAHRPRFIHLDYTDLIIDNKAYFLISWQFRHAYRLKIKSLRYSSFKTGGSAYISIPAQTDGVVLKIANLWASEKVTVNFVRSKLEAQTDFSPLKRYKEINAKSAYFPRFGPAVKKPVLQARIRNVKVSAFLITVKNLIKPA